MQRPVAVRCALAFDYVAAGVALVALPLLIDNRFGVALGIALATPLILIARGVARREPEACLFQAAVLVLASLRLFWSYRPFGAVLTFSLLHAWLQADVLGWFGFARRDVVTAPPAVAGAAYLAAAEIGWLRTLEAPMFIGYHQGALAPLMQEQGPAAMAALLLVGTIGAFLRQRWAWLVLPALLTPVLVASWPVHWGLLLFLGWCTAATRAWFRLDSVSPALIAIAVAVPLSGFAAVQLKWPVGRCAKHAWPLQLVREVESPLIGRVPNALPENAPDWEQLRVACLLEEHAIALRPAREECERARTVMPDERGLPPCPLDRALRNIFGAGALPPHAYGPRARAGRRLTCNTCNRIVAEAP